MTRIIKRLWTVCIVLFVTACVDPIKLTIEDGGGQLVVDGAITTDSGPYVIKLSRSIPFDNSQVFRVYSVPETNAIITISDDSGFSEPLIELESGNYRTQNIQGKVGKSYKINIQTSDGKKYSSTPELIRPPVPIDHLDYEFEVFDQMFINANGSARVTKIEEFHIYAITDDPLGKGNYYRWQADGIYEFFTVIDDPRYKQCWVPVTRLETQLRLASDDQIDGDPFRQFVCAIPYNRTTYYLIKMRQQSLTENAYDYFSKSSIQQNATGSIFDPPPAVLRGNISNEADAEETVLGYFSASSISRNELLINRFPASGLVAPSPNLVPEAGNCLTKIEGATNIKPVGFP